jgi:thymidylate synthase (FAD)
LKYVEPEVYLVARPQIAFKGMVNAVEAHEGGSAWIEKRFYHPSEQVRGTDAENLVEIMGRLCYDSFGVGENGNPNVTRVRDNKFEYFQNIIKSGHGSVLEHAQFSFIFRNVSRVFSHELVRHRVGTAISQESGRYVRPTELEIVKDPRFTEEDTRDFEEIEKRFLARVEGYDWDAMPFREKKEVTSTLRRKLPNGMATEVGWSGNIRALRHVTDMRTGDAAEWEIRQVFTKVARIMLHESAALFS